eukprot:c2672_g1_i1.p1 GENE.c2672_g1_i1~~c2672_g1_i1.p1  ORF type:complete len:395 (+),score=57.81 c2672_g1_i1:1-1185(+)
MGHLQGAVPKGSWAFAWKHQHLFMLAGLFCSLNGFGVVYSVVLSRNGAATQNLIMPSAIIFTALLQWLVLSKPLPRGGLIALFLVAVGVVVALIPNFIHGGFGASSAFWPIMLIIAMIPGAAMNVVMNLIQVRWLKEQRQALRQRDIEHKRPALAAAATTSLKGKLLTPPMGGRINSGEDAPLIKREDDEPAQQIQVYSEAVILMLESVWQTLFISAGFWIDIIPSFGTSNNIHQFWTNFSRGFGCFFHPGSCGPKSHYSAMLCLGFALSYCFTYFGSLGIMSASSPNLNALVALIPSPLAILVWFVVPGLNAWAGGAPIHWIDIGFAIASLVPSIGGLILYRYFESREEAAAIKANGIEGAAGKMSADSLYRSNKLYASIGGGAGGYALFASK